MEDPFEGRENEPGCELFRSLYDLILMGRKPELAKLSEELVTAYIREDTGEMPDPTPRMHMFEQNYPRVFAKTGPNIEDILRIYLHTLETMM